MVTIPKPFLKDYEHPGLEANLAKLRSQASCSRSFVDGHITYLKFYWDASKPQTESWEYGWCRKIGHEGEWTSLEDYFQKGFAIKTSHGMCPQCQEKWAAELQRKAA